MGRVVLGRVVFGASCPDSRLAHSADVYNLHGAKRPVTITNVLSASCPSVNQDGENKPFLHIDCFT